MPAFALACTCGRLLVRRMWSMGCPACGEAEPNDLRRMLRAGASEAVRPLASSQEIRWSLLDDPLSWRPNPEARA